MVTNVLKNCFYILLSAMSTDYSCSTHFISRIYWGVCFILKLESLLTIPVLQRRYWNPIHLEEFMHFTRREEDPMLKGNPERLLS